MNVLKMLWRNVQKGPVTEPFPPDESLTPERLRARVEVNAALCVGCGTCMHVCVAGAINLARKEDGSGFEITVWRNTCCLCGQCRHYCPTKAITLSNNWHNTHRNSEKYMWLTRAAVTYDICEGCGKRMRFLPTALVAKVYAEHPEMNVRHITHLCPDCRRLETAISDDRACRIDHLETLISDDKACPINHLKKLSEQGNVCLLSDKKEKSSS